METLILYTKLNCKLCQQAYDILIEVAFYIPLEIDLVDISHSHNQDIEAKYFDRIPVVASPKSTEELDWPFTPADVKAYLARIIPPE
jgi:hypothetical protein